MTEQSDYHWVMCPKCTPSNPTVWKYGDPGSCWRCGSATVNADHLKRPISWDDQRHSTEAGYVAGCQDTCCTDAHRAYIAWKRANRRERAGLSRKIETTPKSWQPLTGEQWLKGVSESAPIDALYTEDRRTRDDIDDEFDGDKQRMAFDW